MSKSSVLLAAGILLSFFLPKSVISQQQNTQVPFSFFLNTSAKASAGIYKNDGIDDILVRTLWSGVDYAAGSHPLYWDGKDDDGNVMADGNYKAIVQSNNISTDWDIIGNNSYAKTGASVFQTSGDFTGVSFAGTKMFGAFSYSEHTPSYYWFDVNAPLAKHLIDPNGGIMGISTWTDGTLLYILGYGGHDLNHRFIIANNLSDNSLHTFPNGVSYPSYIDQTYNSAIDVNEHENDHLVVDIAGLTGQKNGNYLFAGYTEINSVHVLNKTTGALVDTVSIIKPVAISVDASDNSIWIANGDHTNDVIAKYNINSNGTLSAPVLTINTVSKVLSLAVSPDNNTVAVVDGSSRQQVRFFNTSTGVEGTPLGQSGGYATDPTVTNDKFMFKEVFEQLNRHKADAAVVAYGLDGSLWVNDRGTHRFMHYNADHSFKEYILNMGTNYNVHAIKSNPSRVFIENNEFAVNWNASPITWTMTKNWNYALNENYDDLQQRMNCVTTLSNGRTYAVLPRADLLCKAEIVELPPTGNIRFTGIIINGCGRVVMNADGSIFKEQESQPGNGNTWKKNALIGFDSNNNPLFGPDIVLSAVAPSANEPVGQPYTDQILSDGTIISFDFSGRSGYHLGFARNNKWVVKTSKSTTVDYRGDYPNDGHFDIGNFTQNYFGSVATAVDSLSIWGFRGEFYKNSQVNKWNLYSNKGLFLYQLGITGQQAHNIEPSAAMMAGSVVNAALVRVNSNTLGFLTNDESFHGGAGAWKINGLNTVQTQTININKVGNNLAPVIDFVDLMAGLPSHGTVTTSNGWTRNAISDYLINRDNDAFSISTGSFTYKDGENDILFKDFPQSGRSNSITRDLGTNNLTNWKITGQLAYPQGIENTGSSLIEINDANNNCIFRGSYSGYDRGDSTFGKLMVNGVQAFNVGLATLTLSGLQPFTISTVGAAITFTFGNQVPVTVSKVDASANPAKPKNLKVTIITAGTGSRQIDLANLKFYSSLNTPTPPTINSNDSTNSLTASHALGDSVILVSENGAPFTAYQGPINVGNVARPAGYWQFKVKAGLLRNESAVVNSPAFTVANTAATTPYAPILTADDIANTLVASHALGDSVILVSENGGSYLPYNGQINVGNVARPAAYWQFKVKAAPGRNESAVVNSPAFTVTSTPDAPTVVGNDIDNTLAASHSLGDSAILVCENGGLYLPYKGPINVGDVSRPAGYWKFKIKAAPGRDESAVAASPVFTVSITPDPPSLIADDSANTLSASHTLGNSEILVSENNGAFVQYNGQIDVGNVVRAAGYWKFKIKAAPGRNESLLANSPAFTILTALEPPTVVGDDVANTLSATGSTQTGIIWYSENGGAFQVYNGLISVGNIDRPLGYWKFKVKATQGGNESAIVNSPAFTVTTTPDPPALIADDSTNILIASHPLGNTEILVSENNGAFTAYAGQINVGDVARATGYWKFKIKAAQQRNESIVVNSPEFTIKKITPPPPTVIANNSVKTLAATTPLGDTTILVSENNGAFQPYKGQILVGNVTRPQGYWKFKVCGGPSRNESSIALSPTFFAPTLFILPVELTSIKATQVNKEILIQWTALSETNIDRYEVERSSDTNQFKLVGTVNSKGNSNSTDYSLLDANPIPGGNYYRIKYIDKSGDFKYTSIVYVKFLTEDDNYTVFPNPITNNTVSIKNNNLPKGSFALSVVNNIGQTIYKQTIAHDGGPFSYSIPLMPNLSKGVYFITFQGTDTRFSQQVLK